MGGTETPPPSPPLSTHVYEPLPLSTEQIKYVSERSRELFEIDQRVVDKAQKALFLGNAGGALSTLAFLGDTFGKINSTAGFTALGFFLVGLVTYGAHLVIEFIRVRNAYSNVLADAEKVFSRQLAFKKFVEIEKQRCSWLMNTSRNVAYSSFACFICGCLGGFIGLYLAI
jgi:hypothetical protein